MRTKTVSIILILFILFNSAATSVSAEEKASVNVNFNYALEFLRMLDILPDTENEDSSRVVTRGEFTYMAVRMTNNSSLTEDDSAFDDVSMASDYGREVYDALALGIISKAENRLFNPDLPTTYNAGIKMVVSALGYEKLAIARGGYPSGYVSVAGDLGILRGVKNSFSLADAVILVSNALRADVWLVDAIVDDSIAYTKETGKNLLTENFELTLINGVATVAGLYSVKKGYSSTKGMLEIDKKAYECNIPGVEKYLGYRMDAWYNDQMEVVAVLPERNNSSLVINADDIESYSDFNLKIYNGNKAITYNIDKGYSFIKNGRFFDQSDSDFKFENGTLELIDNNGDKRYDYVIVKESTFFVVSAINDLEKTIYDSDQPNETIAVSNNVYTKIKKYNLKTKIYTDADFDSIAVGNLLEVRQSADKDIVEINIISGNNLSGTVQEKGTDYVVLDDKTYELTKHFIDFGGQVILNQKANFALSSEGKIVAKLEGSDQMQYGYYLGFSSGNGTFKTPAIKILTASNQIAVYDIAKKLIFDSERLSNDNKKLEDKLLISDKPKYQLIKYSINSEGMIDAIDTASESADSIPIVNAEGNDTLTQYVNKGNSLYKSSGVLVPYCMLAGGVLFSVPENLTIGEVYSDDFFVCRSAEALENDAQLVVDLYDYSEHYIPRAAVIYNMNGASGSLTMPATSSTSYMVEAVTTALDRDGAKTAKLTLCSVAGYKYYVVSSRVYSELLEKNKIPGRGDVIRISLDIYNEITGIARDVIYNADGTLTVNYVDGVSSSGKESFTYVAGKVTSFGSGAITVDKEQYASISPLAFVNNKITFGNNQTKAVLYPGENGRVRVIRSSDIMTEMVHGSENADRFLGRVSYFTILSSFVYRID